MADQAQGSTGASGLVQTLINAYFHGPASAARGAIADVAARELGFTPEGFLEWWRPDPGESLLSARNLTKAFGVAAALLGYRHVDPFPQSRQDNFAVYGTGAVLLLLLLSRQSGAMGAQFASFEGRIFEEMLKIYKDDPTKTAEMMQWFQELPRDRETRFRELTRGFKEFGGLVKFLETSETREQFEKLLGDFISEAQKADLQRQEVVPFPTHLAKIFSTIDEGAKRLVPRVERAGAYLRRKGIR